MPAGNLVSTTDAEGNVKRRACDAAGRVISETQAIHADLGPLGINTEGLERRYAYDALGQLTDTLDVYLDGADRAQSGKSVVYNAFGEVVEERRKWGAANAESGGPEHGQGGVVSTTTTPATCSRRWPPTASPSTTTTCWAR